MSDLVSEAGLPPGESIAVEAIDGTFAPERLVSVASVELDGEGVLMEEGSGSLHHLNPAATIVWECLDGSATIDELAAELAAAFRAPVDQVRADVLTLIRDLGARGLLDGVRPDPQAASRGRDHQVQ